MPKIVAIDGEPFLEISMKEARDCFLIKTKDREQAERLTKQAMTHPDGTLSEVIRLQIYPKPFREQQQKLKKIKNCRIETIADEEMFQYYIKQVVRA